MRRLAGLALLALAACSQEPPAPPPPAFVLDCAQGFAPLAGAIAADPNFKVAPKGEGQPYLFYNALDGKTAYVVTEQGSAAHPAIIEQKAARENGQRVMKNGGCSYGDKAGYEELLRYMDSLGGRAG